MTDSSAPSGGAASAQVSGASGSPLVRQNYQSRPRSNSQSNTVEDLTPSSSLLPFPFIMSCDGSFVIAALPVTMSAYVATSVVVVSGPGF